MALSVYCLFLLAVLLVPDGGVPSSGVGRVAGVADAVGMPPWFLDPVRFEFVCNVLILIPATLLASIVWRAPTLPVWTGVGLAFSASVELIQKLFLPGRSGSMVDVVANTIGALIGAAVVPILPSSHWHRTRIRRRAPRKTKGS